MQGHERALVAGVERLQHVDGLGAADLADDDPVRPHAQRVAHEVADRDLALALDVGRARLERDHVRLLQAQLGVVLDGDDALAVGHRRGERVQQRRLAGAGAAADDDVQPRLHQRAQQLRRSAASIERMRTSSSIVNSRGKRRIVIVGPAQRERRDDHVHALAAGQARVDHRAGLVHAPVDGRDDPVDRLEQLRLVGERDVGALDPAGALDVDLVGAVDHDLGHGVVGQQRLQDAQADRLVDDAADQPRALGGGEHGPFARDHAPDDALQPRALLLLREDGDLVEVDLLEQPVPVVADAVRGAVLARARGRRRCDL